MKIRKLGLWQKILAFMLSFMLLIPSIALAKEQELVNDVMETEVVQVDLDEELEKALQENKMGEDFILEKEVHSISEDNSVDTGTSKDENKILVEENVSSDTEQAAEDEDAQFEISPRGVSMPVTALYITGVSGTANGVPTKESIICGQNMHIASNASAEAKTVFDRAELRISVQYIGTHLVSQKQTATGDIDMTNSAPYNNVIDGNGASTQFVIDYILTPRDQDVKQTVFEFSYTPYHADGNGYYPETFYRRLTVNWKENADTGAAPTTPERTFDKATPDQYVITGVTSAMEYRMEGVQEWTECPDGQFLLDVPYDKSTTVYVRYKGENTQSKAITLPPRPAAPTSFTYKKMNETLSPLPTADVEYLLGNATEYSDFTEKMMQDGVLAEMIESIPENYWYRLKIRYKATDTQPASQDFGDIKLGARIAMQPVTFDPITCVLTKSSTTLFMHYKIIAGDKETEWKAFSHDTYSIDPHIFDDRDNTILVRTEASSTLLSHSLPVTFFVPKRTEGCQNISIDFLNEQLIGFETGKNYEYRVGTQATWKDMTLKNGVYPISGFLGENAVEFYVREKGTSATPASAGKRIVLPARSAAPTGIAIKYNVPGYEDKACAIGVKDNQQYSVGGTTNWKDCAGGFVPLNDSAKVYFRNKSTSTAFASLKTIIQVPARGGAPSVSYNQSTERLTLVKPTMEYSIGSGYMPVTGDYLDLSSYIDGLTANSYVWVRYQGNEDKPSSKVAKYRVYKRAAAPATVTFDAATSTLSGVTSKMQYKIGDNGTWTNITNSNPIDLSSRASATENLNIYVRVKYVSNTSAASKSVVFVLPKK